jgi:predicted amidohydrolase YtcJ
MQSNVSEGGVFDLDEDGELSGIIRENALDWFMEKLPARTKDEIKEAICTASEEALRYGITSVHASDLHSCSFDVMIDAYGELKEEGRLPLRVCEQLYLPDLRQLEAYLAKASSPVRAMTFSGSAVEAADGWLSRSPDCGPSQRLQR